MNRAFFVIAGLPYLVTRHQRCELRRRYRRMRERGKTRDQARWITRGYAREYAGAWEA